MWGRPGVPLARASSLCGVIGSVQVVTHLWHVPIGRSGTSTSWAWWRWTTRGRVTTGSASVGATSPAPFLPAARIFLPILISCPLAWVQQAVLVMPVVSIPSACGPCWDTASLLPSGVEAVPLQPALMLSHEIFIETCRDGCAGTGSVSGYSLGIPSLLKHRC